MIYVTRKCGETAQLFQFLSLLESGTTRWQTISIFRSYRLPGHRILLCKNLRECICKKNPKRKNKCVQAIDGFRRRHHSHDYLLSESGRPMKQISGPDELKSMMSDCRKAYDMLNISADQLTKALKKNATTFKRLLRPIPAAANTNSLYRRQAKKFGTLSGV